MCHYPAVQGVPYDEAGPDATDEPRFHLTACD